MRNILYYAADNRNSFEKSPFNDVDALILSWISYFVYPACVHGDFGVRAGDLTAKRLLTAKEMYAEAFNPKKSKKLFSFLQTNPRFQKVRLSRYVEKKKTDERFAALCIRLSADVYFLSFRGTDPSFVAWEEDFCLSLPSDIPSQKSAFKYALAFAEKYPRAKFYLGGHSKGGNLAVYAAGALPEKIKKRIIAVYSFDGPGFSSDIYQRPSYAAVADKIIKIVPRSSFVGMLFETREPLKADSGGISFWQHDPFLWRVENETFRFVPARTKSSVRLSYAVNRWILSMSDEDKKTFIFIVFRALHTLKIENFDDFFRALPRYAVALFSQYKQLVPQEKTFFSAALKKLICILKEKFPENNRNTL